ncbi:hypothetical protein BDD12DRAFT_908392 [Trichophaea hybrida]|nr:hypothetical protein BDD12DRAFT_908392 [Trichophaea hybrida]
MTILMIVTANYSEVLKIMAASTTTSLIRTIDENRPEVGHPGIVDEVLGESVAGIYEAVVQSGGNYPSATSTSGAIHALLVAAQEARSSQLIKVLSESWIQQWDRASRHNDQCQRGVGLLIEERGTEQYDTIRLRNREKQRQLLDKVDLQERLSTSLVTNLSNAKRSGDEGAGIDQPMNEISNTGLQLLLTTIKRKDGPLTKDMAESWVATLDNLESINPEATTSKTKTFPTS